MNTAKNLDWGRAITPDGAFCEIYGTYNPAPFALLKKDIRTVCSRVCEECDYQVLVVRENSRESFEKICDLTFIQ